MGRHQECSVCTHPDRQEIELLVKEGHLSQRAAAKQFGLHKTQLQRHFTRHAPYQVPKSVLIAREKKVDEPEQVRARKGSALHTVRNLRKRFDNVMTAAEETGQVDVILRSGRELRHAVALEAQLSGEARSADSQNKGSLTINIMKSFDSVGPDGEVIDAETVEVEPALPSVALVRTDFDPAETEN